LQKSAGLEGKTKERYIRYMRLRWSNEEEIQCKTGYAEEWAMRFKNGIEYAMTLMMKDNGFCRRMVVGENNEVKNERRK